MLRSGNCREILQWQGCRCAQLWSFLHRSAWVSSRSSSFSFSEDEEKQEHSEDRSQKHGRKKKKNAEEEEFRHTADWVQVPRHCAARVQKICTMILEAQNFDSYLRKTRDNLNPDIVLGVLRNYRRIGRENTLRYFSWAGKQSGYCHNRAVVEFMADFLGRRKIFDQLLDLLRDLALQNSELVTSRAIAGTVRFLGRAGKIEEALWVFDNSEKEFKCSPDNLILNNVLYVLCKSGSVPDQDLVCCVEKGLEIFHQMSSPDKFSYSNVIIGLCRIGRIKSALQVFDEMMGKTISPSTTAMNYLVDVLLKESKKHENTVKVDWFSRSAASTVDILVPSLKSSRLFDVLDSTDKARQFLDLAVKTFITVGKRMNVFPSFFVANMLVECLTDAGKVDDALRVFGFMGKKGLKRDKDTYSALIRGLFRVSRSGEAFGLFCAMIQDGIVPEVAVFNSAITALCKEGNLRDAEKCLDLLRSKKNSVPDSRACTTLLHAYCKANDWLAASDLLNLMLENKCIPQDDIFGLVENVLRKAGKLHVAESLLNKMDTLYVHRFCEVGDWHSAYDKLNLMRNRGFFPGTYTLDHVEEAIRKSGNWDLVVQFRSKFRRGVQNGNRS